MKEALLYEKLDNKKVKCNVCERRCIVKLSNRGYCQTRINLNGKFYSLIYGMVSTWMCSPIEKKPMFHFYPGSRALSLGSLGCNFRCPGCQNYDIAHTNPEIVEGWKTPKGTQYIPAEESVEMALKYKCDGISWTYNEPTLWFEYTLDSAKFAKGKGLYTNYVTNGYITPEALDIIGKYLDSFRVDVKGFRKETYQKIAKVTNFEKILEVTESAKHKWKMHVEIVTNIIPTYNDDEEELKDIASWIYKNLGRDTPWHVTAFVPHLYLSHLNSTPVKILENAKKIGEEKGLRFVYIGNIPGHPGENTYCPDCKKLLIERKLYEILSCHIQNGKCGYCKEKIPIVGECAVSRG